MRRRHQAEFRFDARYGRLIRKAGIGTVPFALFHYQGELGLTVQEVWFTSYVLAHRWTSDLPYPSLAKLSRRAGISKQTARKYKDSLVAKGLLVTWPRDEYEPRSDGATVTSSSWGYDFSPLLQALDRLITRDIDDWARRNPQFLEEADAGEDEDDDLDPEGDMSAHTPRGQRNGSPGGLQTNTPRGDGASPPGGSSRLTLRGKRSRPHEEEPDDEDSYDVEAVRAKGAVSLRRTGNPSDGRASEPSVGQETTARTKSRRSEERPASDPAPSGEEPGQRSRRNAGSGSGQAARGEGASRGNGVRTAGGKAPVERASAQGARKAEAAEQTEEDEAGADPQIGGLANRQLWQAVLADLRSRVTPSDYATWLARTRLLA
ncbi:MAG: hypothetical protein HY329_27165, partial [Chloroflexi bacterium]|nr:hypothetical protein [Chloroflexota bacterium]